MRRRRIKKLIALIVTILILVSTVTPPFSMDVKAAAKAKTVKTVKVGSKIVYGTLKYKVTKLTKKGGTVSVIGVKEKSASVTIPASFKIKVKKGKYKGKHTLKVTSVAQGAFSSNMKLRNLTIGGNVKTIGQKAFYKAMNLRSVKLGKNITQISDYAFSGDFNLRTVTVPAGSKLKKIGKYAFRNCINLCVFDFKKATGLTTFGSFAFAYCDKLSGIPREKTPEFQKLLGNVKKYSYTIKPIFENFNYIFYVKTDNPDPTSFRFVDKSSKYYDKDTSEFDMLTATENRYCDVKYENKSKGRVHGGYIFKASSNSNDGGEYSLEVYTNNMTPGGLYKEWVDTGIKVKSARLVTGEDYILENYVKSSMSFFEKLDAIETALCVLSLYPKGTYDDSKRIAGSYPCLCTSPYPELCLNEHYEGIYEKSEEKPLFYWHYPYVMDSLGFPGYMSYFAKEFQPKCTISSGGVHYLISVTYNGKTKYYGGAGNGNSNEFFKSALGTRYTFTGESSDLGTHNTLKKAQEAYIDSQTKSDKIISKYHDQLSGDEFVKKIGNGTWLRTGREGGGISYVYVSKGEDFSQTNGYYSVASNMWVDGWYINVCEYAEKGTSFDKHPTANIMIRNMKYTNYYGEEMTGDVVFSYDETTSCWKSDVYFQKKGSYWTDTVDGVELPDEFVLTLDEVKEMKVDRNKDKLPEHGLIYDGDSEPGTAF